MGAAPITVLLADDDVVGAQFHGFPILHNGFVELPFLKQRVREIIAGHQVIRLDLQRALKLGDGAVQLLPGEQGIAAIVMRLGEVRTDAQRRLKLANRLVNALLLQQRVAEIHMGFRIIW